MWIAILLAGFVLLAVGMAKRKADWGKGVAAAGTLGVVLALLVAGPRVAVLESNSASQPSATQDIGQAPIQNLRAFALLYGLVRYFHPSDAASATDWERLAVHGARQVQQAETPDELRATLTRLFRPLAPTMQLYPTGEAPPVPPDVLTPADTAGLQLVAWQHRGLGLGNPGPYCSIRLNRTVRGSRQRQTSGYFKKNLDAASYQGKQIRLKAAVKTSVSGSGNQAQLWLRVDREGGQHGFFSNMGDRPITSSNWTTYDITGVAAKDAEQIVFGGFLKGNGQAWLDDFELLVKDSTRGKWTPVSLENAGFEAGTPGSLPPGWKARAPGYRFMTDRGTAFEGNQSILISSSSGERKKAEPLFEARPDAGEVVTRSLGRGLSVQLPLALYSRDGQTLRPEEAPSPKHLRSQMEDLYPAQLTAEDAALRYADVVIAWNIFQHFYPYFDVVDVDWDAVLTRTLRRAAADETSEEFLQTLRRMVAQLDDGHGGVGHPLRYEKAGLPLKVSRVEGHVVVTTVSDSAAGTNACFQRGDVVTSLDGTSSKKVLRQSMEHLSGSPQWKTEKALNRFGIGEYGTEARLKLRRGEETLTCQVARTFDGQLAPARPAPIEELRDDLYYVNLGEAQMSAIREQLQALADAKGIIFDMRGYPEDGNQAVLQHLSNDTLRSAHWQVPQLIYPDQKNQAGYSTSRWQLPPKKPRFTGEIVFLTGPGAISYAESIMGIVEHYELGEIVGQPTAGTNGNINPFTLPGDYRVFFTGMRVVKNDRSQHHLVGIQPTVSVEQTLEDVRAGRDASLQQAIELIRAGGANGK